jgi:glycosyltransferase involved in cell wall biosynthesis
MNICFVTNELHPFRPGGIGRLMYNFAVQNRDTSSNRCKFFFLVPSSDIKDTAELEDFYERNNLGIVVNTPTEFSFLGAREGKLFQSLWDDYTASGFIRKSIEYYNGLIYLEAKYGITLDVIEFPDYGGWGFTTLSAKRAGLRFVDTKIAVRLHSTAGIIRDAEPFYHKKGPAQQSFNELERQCIGMADLVVSHLPVITDVNQQFYQFDAAWKDHVIHEFPPIFLDKDEVFAIKSDGSIQDFIFSSRLQPFKRPDLFIKAAIIFLDRHPDYPGKFYVASYGWDKKYIDWLVSLVPERHLKMVLFIFSADANVRNRLLQQSIVVIPSNYESLCVFAYESALRGTKLILNGECLAFGKTPYWKDGENCLLFDGSAEHLADIYEKALSLATPRLKPLPESLCYWHKKQLPEPAVGKEPTDGKLAVIVYGCNPLAKANERLFELSGLIGSPKFELHLIINAKHQRTLAFKVPEQVNIHFCSWDVPNPNYIKTLLGNLKADYVAFSPPNGHVTPEFYTRAQNALNLYQDLSIVTSHVRALTDVDAFKNQDWQAGNRDDYGGEGWAKLSVGGAPSLALIQTNIVSEYSCFRLNDIDYAAIHEESGELFLPLLLNGAIRNGTKVLVIPKLYITELPSQTAYLSESNLVEV